MHSITILGLGPGDPELLTRKAWRVLSEAPLVILRTARHPGVDRLPIGQDGRRSENFDALYDQASDFAALYEQIAAQVVDRAVSESVVYAVPGHPLMGESTVTKIIALAKSRDIPVEVIDGLSFLEPMLAALGLDGLDGLQLHDGIDIARMHHPPLNPDTPALLAQVYSRAVASDVKLTLANQYPDDHPVVLVHGAGTPDAALEHIPLHSIDHSPRIDHLTSLYVPPLPKSGSFEAFQEVIAHLRAPEGCPWDRKQNHLSLRKYLIEETYEVLEALDAEDTDSLKDELGDLLLQIVLHSQIAVEYGEFSMADVLENVIAKMIRRHPHVWGTTQADTADQVVLNWEQIKQREKAALKAEHPESEQPASVLDSIPKGLPSLARAEKIHQKAAKAGFDWTSLDDVWAKVHEEIAELRAATDPNDQRSEFGDIFGTLINIARWMDIDADSAMRENNQKFERRFRYVESHAGRPLKDLSLADMDTLWVQAKRLERESAREK